MDETAQKQIFWKLCLMQFLIAGAVSSSTMFQIVYLRSKGMNDLQTGVMLSLCGAAPLCGRLLWPYVCDRLRKTRAVFVFLCAVAAASLVTANLLPQGMVVPAMALYTLMGFTLVPALTIMDSWTFKSMKGFEADFGRVRLFYALGTSCFVLLNGQLATRLGWRFVMGLFVLFVGGMVLCSLALREPSYHEEGGEGALRSSAVSVKPLLQSKPYCLFILWAVIALLFAGLSFAYFPVKCEQISKTPAFFSTVMFVSNLCEMLFLALTPKIVKKTGPLGLAALGVASYGVNGVLMFFARTPWGIYAAMPFNGIGESFFQIGAKSHVMQIAPLRLKTTAIGVGEALYFGLAYVLTGLLGGFLVKDFGLQASLATGAAVTLGAAALVGLLLLAGRVRRSKNV